MMLLHPTLVYLGITSGIRYPDKRSTSGIGWRRYSFLKYSVSGRPQQGRSFSTSGCRRPQGGGGGRSRSSSRIGTQRWPLDPGLAKAAAGRASYSIPTS
jgi:hypothetical protein